MDLNFVFAEKKVKGCPILQWIVFPFSPTEPSDFIGSLTNPVEQKKQEGGEAKK
jgi:hypothetical protein